MKPVTITPEMALELLTSNIQNRSVNQRRVDALAALIRDGKWIIDGNPIRIARSGRLLDGQHRLYAIIEAEVPVDSYLVTDLDEEAEFIIDTGKPRMFAEHLRRKGISSVSMVSAVTRLLMLYRQKYMETGRFWEFMPSLGALWEFYTENQEAITEGIRLARDVGRFVRLSPSVLNLGAIILAEVDADDCDYFYQQLSKRMPSSVPVQVLDRWASLRAVRSHSPSEQRMQLAVVIKAWNKYRDHDEPRQLAWRPGEPFPAPH